MDVDMLTQIAAAILSGRGFRLRKRGMDWGEGAYPSAAKAAPFQNRDTEGEFKTER
jgi:hypothetical protein